MTKNTERKSGGGRLATALVVLALLLAGGWVWAKRQAGTADANAKAGGVKAAPVPIIAGVVEQRDVPIYLDGLGTVQAFNSVTVRTRIDGQIERIAFVEGQDVRAGDLLAQIDPAPYRAQLDQNIAKKAQDDAQLSVARLTLKRDADLLASKIVSQQDYDTQKALVDQYEATVKADQAAIDSARTQLGYATITSPIDGRTGIRLVDQGNIVRANDTDGLVVVAQLRPISVVFTLPEQSLGQIQDRLKSGDTLTVQALDRDNRAVRSEGKLAVVDNQIDTGSGTIRLKATFANEDLTLWPGQFVNARLLVETRKGGLVVPASVIQRGPDGPFAFVITDDMTAQPKPVKVAQIEQGLALIEGLRAGDRVVVDGQYRLQAGSKVKLPETAGPKTNAEAGKSRKSETRNPKSETNSKKE